MVLVCVRKGLDMLETCYGDALDAAERAILENVEARKPHAGATSAEQIAVALIAKAREGAAGKGRDVSDCTTCHYHNRKGHTMCDTCGFDARFDNWTLDKDTQIADLRSALREIVKGGGRYSPDALEHASDAVESMKKLAQDALEI